MNNMSTTTRTRRQNRRSKCGDKKCEPSQYDILSGKDKTLGKHNGNLLFRERIDAMKVSYSNAPTKQEKMTITKDIVTHMQSEYGSRFLKMEGSMWVEISNQAARDKVSHALRFAARNLTASARSRGSSKTSRQSRKRRSDDSVSTTSNRSSSSSSDEDRDNFKRNNTDDEPVPLSQIFDHAFEINFGPQSFHNTQVAVASVAVERKSEGYLNFGETSAFATSGVQQQQLGRLPDHEDDFVASTRLSLRSMQLDETLILKLEEPSLSTTTATTTVAPISKKIKAEPEFDTLRSEDLNDIFNEPLDGDEWEAVAQIAEC